ncbi:DUF1822 family protein [Merismopedia glauca]|uniref:DUF1822 domain-containing protein n=1 Tax=Merismopedia glauca CCAP 1448/3 TaxID=1296344 RepID=A0A2T1C1V0_9CYAN|nr:DUF1822 family protein [Merismopedia glauca]PSB02249.1 hypothetical protein C7B64_14055 [Merismopedia glauca CCAP 1448/3]
MSFQPTIFNSARTSDLILEISPSNQEKAWQQSQRLTTATNQWQAYLNQLCLSAILPWLQEDYSSSVRPWLGSAALGSFWELTNGTAVMIDGARLVLVPSETLDLSELRVPQEWVDIPEWAGDYYLPVQIDPDEGWVRLWGYCTHQQLKRQGMYETSDRSYTLEATDLVNDISAFGVARQLCPQEATRAQIAPLPKLALAQAQNLLQRLGNSALINPRLAIPFEFWGALLAHGGWRQELYQLRLGNTDNWSVVKWLQQEVSQLAQDWGWGKLEFQPVTQGARGSIAADKTASLTRKLVIAGKGYQLRVIPKSAGVWRFELQSEMMGNQIPIGFKLRLLTEDLQPFANNEDIARKEVDRLYIDVVVESGEGLVWEIEPLPENSDREILRF